MSDNGIRISVSVRTGFGAGDGRAGMAALVNRVRASRDAGLAGLYVGDHHSQAPDRYYQNVPTLARLAAEWPDADLGALFLVPLWNPVLLAEQVGVLSTMTTGRLSIQLAVGAGEAQFAAMGKSLETRRRDLETSMRIIRGLLAGETVSVSGVTTGASIAPIPPEPVEMWMAGHAQPVLDRAARADGWLAGPGASDAELARMLSLYRDSCEHHRRPIGRIALRRDVHIGVDDADAGRVADPILTQGYRGFDPAVTVVGGPQRVADRVRSYQDMGFTDILIRHLAGDESQVLASTARFAKVRELLGQ
ncbi:LLM class flavin-dependent oxidoreductase [Gordonia sp. CPCC 205333]|uniref:LLM class flavin-dependent oxidoreductase n=1 Tax=Gordonia sp. CPCC 205333 TaxID=3140790 RepID=UPI003AF3CA6D